MSLYKDSSVTITSQVTGIATRSCSRTPNFRQSSSALIPENVPIQDMNVSINKDNPYLIQSIKHFIQFRCNFNVELVLKKDGVEIPLGIKQLFVFHGSLDGEIEVRTESEDFVPIHVVFA